MASERLEKPPKNPRILVVEFGHHLPQVEHLLHVLRTLGRAFLVFRSRRAIDFIKSFHEFETASVHSGHFPSNPVLQTLEFYVQTILRSTRADIVWVSTGPEQRVLADVIFFWCLAKCFRNKLVLQVRHPDAWTGAEPRKHPHSAIDRIRGATAKIPPWLVFETQTNEAYFFQQAKAIHSRSISLSTKNSDYPERGIESSATSGLSNSLNLGILGGLDEVKRDYESVRQALIQLPEHTRDAMTIRFLGDSSGPKAEEIIGRLEKLVTVDFTPGYLSTADALAKTKDNHILLLPLRSGSNIGTQRASGATGDALEAGLQVLAPRHFDPFGEFSELVVPYDDSMHLSMLLESYAKSGEVNRIPERMLRRYATSVHRRAIAALMSDRINFQPEPEHEDR